MLICIWGRRDTFFDSDDEKMDGDTVMDYHFGGGEDQDPERRKTKQEVMAEIIAKSKMYKAEKRKEKDERDEDLEKLNSGFADISALLAANERPPRERVSRKEAKEAAPIDDFDQLARDLMDDMKAQASSRLKTPEEVMPRWPSTPHPTPYTLHPTPHTPQPKHATRNTPNTKHEIRDARH
jgi:hypothetical protein